MFRLFMKPSSGENIAIAIELRAVYTVYTACNSITIEAIYTVYI
jgi:hypothetical protein